MAGFALFAVDACATELSLAVRRRIRRALGQGGGGVCHASPAKVAGAERAWPRRKKNETSASRRHTQSAPVGKHASFSGFLPSLK